MLKTQLLDEDERTKCVARVNYSVFELLLIFLPVLSLPAVFCLCRKVSYLTPLLLLLAQFFLYSTPTTGAAFAATSCVRLIIAENFFFKNKLLSSPPYVSFILLWSQRSPEGTASVQRPIREGVKQILCIN